MSSFFGKLAGRTLGTTPTVQPSLAPLFAPGPALHGTLPTGIIEEGFQEVQSRLEQERQTTVTSSVVVQDAMPQAPTRAGRTRIPDGQLNVQMVDRLNRPQSSSSIHTNAVAGNLPQKLPAGESFTTTITPVRLATKNPSGRIGIPGGEQEMLQAIVPLLPQTGSEMRAAASAMTSPRRVSQEGPLAETAPTIRISIGRVEVRAVHNTSSPLPQARPVGRTPQPSLESYLQARNRGKP